VKRFACNSIVLDCGRVFVGAGDHSVLDQVLAHAAAPGSGTTKPMNSASGVPVASRQEVRERRFVASPGKVRLSAPVTPGFGVGWPLVVARVSSSSARAWI